MLATPRQYLISARQQAIIMATGEVVVTKKNRRTAALPHKLCARAGKPAPAGHKAKRSEVCLLPCRRSVGSGGILVKCCLAACFVCSGRAGYSSRQYLTFILMICQRRLWLLIACDEPFNIWFRPTGHTTNNLPALACTSFRHLK